MSDVAVSDHGSIVVITPLTEEATQWCEEHLPEDAPMWGPRGYAVERRFVGPIITGMEEYGLEVEG